MAVFATNLNNIAASIGRSNFWIYDSITTMAATKVADFFNGATDYGMHDGDIMTVVCTDGTYQCQIAVAAGVVTLSALDAF